MAWKDLQGNIIGTHEPLFGEEHTNVAVSQLIRIALIPPEAAWNDLSTPFAHLRLLLKAHTIPGGPHMSAGQVCRFSVSGTHKLRIAQPLRRLSTEQAGEAAILEVCRFGIRFQLKHIADHRRYSQW